MKVKILLIAAILLSGTIGVRAQDQVEAHLGADIVSDYFWRGQDFGNVSLQPELSVGCLWPHTESDIATTLWT